jgi:hypothetical protein
MRYLIPMSIVLLGLYACSEPAETPQPEAYDPSTDVIGAPLHQALDKAGAVEGLSEERKSELDDAIDAGSPTPE